MKRITHLSLFSGIGGLDLAAQMAGIETIAFCEWADYPRRVLEKRWPGKPIWKDIREITEESFFERTGRRTIDVISGGFPCQPFSAAGKRRGKADDRYLWDEMLRVIKALRPAWVIGENVAGLTSMAEPAADAHMAGRTINRYPGEDYYNGVLLQPERMLLDEILEGLSTAGYDVQAFVIPACGVGAFHQRERLSIVGHTQRG